MHLGNMLQKGHEKAKEFHPNSTWLNTDSKITLASLRGQVVILDFWTYCCINCMHMLRELDAIEKRYEREPVVVIGVHSAKFTNEARTNNILAAVDRYGITHPVIVDEGMRIWRSYGADGWPTIVIIDPEGNVVYRRSGEGQQEFIAAAVDGLLDLHRRNGTLGSRVSLSRHGTGQKHGVLSFPGKIAISPDSKRIAISDSNNCRIILAALDTGVVEKVVGGKKGFLDGSLETAAFDTQQGIVWKDDNTVFIADTENHAIREVDLRYGSVKTIAGTGKKSHWLALGGDAARVGLNSPWDVAYDKDTNALHIAMAGTNQLWSYVLGTGKITPLAGSGYEGIEDGKGMGCLLAQPSGLAYSSGMLYFADSEASAIRRVEISTKRVETLVGEGLFEFGYRDGGARGARFQHPIGLCVDENAVYVADTYNSAVRRVGLDDRMVSTVVGSKENPGVCRFGSEGCDVLGLYEPNDVKKLGDVLYIADTNNHLIRKFDMKTGMLGTFELSFSGDSNGK